MADQTIQIIKACRVRGRDRQPGNRIQVHELAAKALIAQGKAKPIVAPELRVKVLRPFKGHQPGAVLDLPMALAERLEAEGIVARHSPKRPTANKEGRGPSETKEEAPPSRLAAFSEQEIIEELERRTERPFIDSFPTRVLVKEVSKRHTGNGAHAFETDQLLGALHERGAIEKTDEPFEALTVSLPSLAEVKSKPARKFDAFQADLRAVGVKGRSWDELGDDYEAWIAGLLAPLEETKDLGTEPAPTPDTPDSTKDDSTTA